jgi:hypothetical protein
VPGRGNNGATQVHARCTQACWRAQRVDTGALGGVLQIRSGLALNGGRTTVVHSARNETASSQWIRSFAHPEDPPSSGRRPMNTADERPAHRAGFQTWSYLTHLAR